MRSVDFDDIEAVEFIDDEIDEEDLAEIEDYIAHHGTPHQGYTPHSGRYKWGSGENAYQRHGGFLQKCKEMKDSGMTDEEIWTAFGMTSTEYRAKKAKDLDAYTRGRDNAVYKLVDKQWSAKAISQRLDIPLQTVYKIMNRRNREKKESLNTTVETLKQCVEKDKYVDVGKGVNQHMGISSQKLINARKILQDEGYTCTTMQIKTSGPNFTAVQVLAAPGTTRKEIFDHLTEVKLPFTHSEDGGRTYYKKEPIQNIDSKRIYVRYGEEGGTERDGTIELRPGCEDLNLGRAHYAQVRIGVDGEHFMKGMALYKDNIPEGYDIVFNTKKPKGTSLAKVLKPQSGDDPSNPFGSSIKMQDEDLELIQRHYIGKDGKEHLSAINVVKEEGDVGKWKDSSPSQFLSKQYKETAQKQLDMDVENRQKEFDELMSLTNPAVKKKLLESFADECDGAAVHLAGAAMPRQSTNFILPFSDIRDDEIYAPNYKQGEEVALVRFPHQGVFEIPILKVNNRSKEAQASIGTNPRDAVGISQKTAAQLSGADFDGDTVLVIPTKGYKIKSHAPLPSLQSFDTDTYAVDFSDEDLKKGYYNGQKIYKNKQGRPTLTKKAGDNMGNISNLITDMHIKEAPIDELERASKYAMVVIDAYKHGLDWRQAKADFAIDALKEKYQGGVNRGASTLISKSTSDMYVDKRKSYYKIDKETGAKIWEPADDQIGYKPIKDKDGNIKIDPATGKKMYKEEVKKTKTTKGMEMDPYELMSSEEGTPMERIYADYATRMKKMGDLARLESTRTGNIPYDSNAAKIFKDEVESLERKLVKAEQNAPLERRAWLIANKTVELRKENNPMLKEDNDALKKVKDQAIKDARQQVGAGKERIVPTDKEWEAIQSGAIHKTKLESILKEMDDSVAKKLAMPKEKKTYSDNTIAKAKQMLAKGATVSEIAERLGISVDAVHQII
jgi:hypothetical protein